MLDLNTLNTRLAACQLPVVVDPGALPEGVTLERLTHALGQAERGQNGARQFLLRHLSHRPAAAPPPPPPAPTRPAAPCSGATPQTPTAPHPAATSNANPAPAAAPARSAAPRSGTTPVFRDRVQCRVYGSKAALCIETDVTRQDEPTLRLEAAPATGPRAYDWPSKLTLQLTREELPVVAATVLGLLPRCLYKNHGPDQNKGLEIEHQGSHLFVRLFQKERGVLAVPVGPADSYYLAALALRALRQGTPWLSDQGLLMVLKLTIQRMSAAQNVKQ